MDRHIKVPYYVVMAFLVGWRLLFNRSEENEASSFYIIKNLSKTSTMYFLSCAAVNSKDIT